ncbi:hypothetical protein GGR54DRAFT_549581 [Hypoxylon sp. NC1633]|nr:hypothetical protein GGR54DRAFT_549581 [Hypoxylon sp. NC1633]
MDGGSFGVGCLTYIAAIGTWVLVSCLELRGLAGPLIEHGHEPTQNIENKNKKHTTPGIRWSSPTQLGTDLAITGLSVGEQTGSRVFQFLWSYVLVLHTITLYIENYLMRVCDRNCSIKLSLSMPCLPTYYADSNYCHKTRSTDYVGSSPGFGPSVNDELGCREQGRVGVTRFQTK